MYRSMLFVHPSVEFSFKHSKQSLCRKMRPHIGSGHYFYNNLIFLTKKLQSPRRLKSYSLKKIVKIYFSVNFWDKKEKYRLWLLFVNSLVYQEVLVLIKIPSYFLNQASIRGRVTGVASLCLLPRFLSASSSSLHARTHARTLIQMWEEN